VKGEEKDPGDWLERKMGATFRKKGIEIELPRELSGCYCGTWTL